MKQATLAILASISVLALSGCGGNTSASADAAESETAAANSDATEIAAETSDRVAKITPDIIRAIHPGETSVYEVMAMIGAEQEINTDRPATATLRAPSITNPEFQDQVIVNYDEDQIVTRVRYTATAHDQDDRAPYASNSSRIEAFRDDRPEFFNEPISLDAVWEQIGFDFRRAEFNLRQDGHVYGKWGFGYAFMFDQIMDARFAVVVSTRDDQVTNLAFNYPIY